LRPVNRATRSIVIHSKWNHCCSWCTYFQAFHWLVEEHYKHVPANIRFK